MAHSNQSRGATWDAEDEPTQIYQRRPEPPSWASEYQIAFSADDVRPVALLPLRNAYLNGQLPECFILEPGRTEWKTPAQVFGARVLAETPQRSHPAPPRRARPAPAAVPPVAVAQSTAAPTEQRVATTSRAAASPPLALVPAPSQTVRPVSYPESIPQAAPRRSRIPVYLLAAALICGTLVTLQRQGILYAWAADQGLGTAYEQLEAKALGGPGRETPRGLTRFLQQSLGRTSAVGALSVPAPPPESATPAPVADAPVPAAEQAVAEDVIDVSELAPVPVTPRPKVEHPTASVPVPKPAEEPSASPDPVDEQAASSGSAEPGVRKANAEALPVKTQQGAGSAKPSHAAPSGSEVTPAKVASKGEAKKAPKKPWKRDGVKAASVGELNSAIRMAVDKAKSKRKKNKKKKKSASEFDPLNPEI